MIMDLFQHTHQAHIHGLEMNLHLNSSSRARRLLSLGRLHHLKSLSPPVLLSTFLETSLHFQAEALYNDCR